VSDDELIKIVLHNDGEDVETVWAVRVDQGADRTLVRLDNVPFMHAKPTYGDVIEVAPDEQQGGRLSWNSHGLEYDEIVKRIFADGGRYAVITEYRCPDETRFGELTDWVRREGDLESEGCFGPREERPGRLYFAAPDATEPAAVMALLARNPFGFVFTLVHPVDDDGQ
jgi:hypothetical protein